jgi:hypothetical protein
MHRIANVRPSSEDNGSSIRVLNCVWSECNDKKLKTSLKFDAFHSKIYLAKLYPSVCL